jgi:ABC-type lipoprotein release transport system permease subunit
VTFTRSVDVLFASREQWGAMVDAIATADNDSAAMDEGVAALKREDEIAAAAIYHEAEVTARNREGEPFVLPVTSFTPIKGQLDYALRDGDRPESDDEVLVGAHVLDVLDADLGDTIEITNPDGDQYKLRIAGEAITYGPDSIDDGIVVTTGGADQLDVEENPTVVARFARDVSEAAGMATLRKHFPNVEVPPRPGSIDNLDELGLLPAVLAIVVGVLGAVAAGVALMAGTSRRRRELATQRSVGATGGQLSATVVWHAAALVLVGIVFGVPLGIALGRAVYLTVVNGIGAIARPELAAGGLALLVAGAVVAALVLALVPAINAARLRPGPALRSE